MRTSTLTADLRSTDAGKSALSESAEKTLNADGLLSVKEASDLLRMSDKWLYQSDIPFVRMGRRRLYFRAILLDYARQRLSNARLGAK